MQDTLREGFNALSTGRFEVASECCRRVLGAKHPRMLAYLANAIGKECEDLQDWQQAGEAFRQGAAARRKTVAYDEAAEIELFQAAAALFSREWFEHREPGPQNISPIFIVGEPRSGTRR